MFTKIKCEDFLVQNRISKDQWLESGCDWDILVEIASDYMNNIESLKSQAEFFSNLIQKIDQVHSVRWRIKDVNHLIAKIIRKRADKIPKYIEISKSNYFEIVTDLIGIRALHLFKDDCFGIVQKLTQQWASLETPIAYIRAGDHEKLIQKFTEYGFAPKIHPAGYRSIHYIFSSQATRLKLTIEVQIRTIFEEGWSEIDHKVRYPNLSDKPLVDYFLTIFNRMAGSADEMGGFVISLANTLNETNNLIEEIRKREEISLNNMTSMIEELEQLKKQDKSSNTVIVKLKSELQQLKSSKGNELLLQDRFKGSSGLQSLDRLSESSGLSSLDHFLESSGLNSLKRLKESSALNSLDRINESSGLNSLKRLKESSALNSLDQLKESSTLNSLDRFKKR